MAKRKEPEDIAALVAEQQEAWAKVKDKIRGSGVRPYTTEVAEDGTMRCRCGGSEWFEVTDPADPNCGRVIPCPDCLGATAIKLAAGKYHPVVQGTPRVKAPVAEQLPAF